MTRVKAAAVLLAFIIICSVSSLFLLGQENGRLKDRIAQVQYAYEGGDRERACALSEELTLYWKDYEKKVTVLVHDDALSDISISIAKLSPLILSDNGEFKAEILSLYQQIDRLYEEEFPKWYNIL